ncbi:putative vacuolar protein sorting-associated protein Ist1 [Rosa chinensis]|uniref:Putative vacuolar protein sorting-associated protein Ist1 n=1 Tax=Rosa chinensis TaxID=74649 RepID=A0A2P6PNP7_ROSCH|nr:uncharacterized protein LOC112172974 [Rosa chinensis]XP_040363756.1 uncharacterized protein LOC112172974 [Rosa chinensis]XP_040363757.1 uncharacterized protein LOC112172974 [Rosa chinensis]PRQ23541.1 putative vacuolar protein sorting-associated protein Ist1 [Rosa chinensis]
MKVRLEATKKKRNSVLKYLKNGFADRGLDINAYGRKKISETKVFPDKEKINKSCKESCPEECKEAVASVIYATTRFLDLPELHDLRNILAEKYGDSAQSFVNKEFVDKFKPKPLTKDMKVQVLMHDIAREYSIEWGMVPLGVIVAVARLVYDSIIKLNV